MPRRLPAALLALELFVAPAAQASQATLVTPAAPLPMTSLATFLNAAYLSIGSCNSGTSAPANGTGTAAFAGECWIDTTANPWKLQITDDATHWPLLGVFDTTNHVFVHQGVERLLFVARGINFNAVGDTAFPISLPSGVTNYKVVAVHIANASATITTSRFGVFSAVSGGGTQIMAAGQIPTVSTASANTNNNAETATPTNANTQSFNFSTIYFRVGTVQGSAVTADVMIVVIPM